MTKDGARLETHQLVYITDTSARLFLSKEACITLGMRLETRQLVYITDTSARLFLSKEACITLGMRLETRQLVYITDTSASLFLSKEACITLGMRLETRQLVYITDTSDRLFLSKEACLTLGMRLETRQLVYITDTSDRLFLSKEACITLGMISTKFPTIGEIQQTHHSTQILNAVDTLTQTRVALQSPVNAQDVSFHQHLRRSCLSQPQRKTARNSRNICSSITNPALSIHVNTKPYQ